MIHGSCIFSDLSKNHVNSTFRVFRLFTFTVSARRTCHTQSFRSQTGPNKWYQSRSSIAQIKRTNTHRNPSDSESNLLRFVKFLHTFLFFTFLFENRKINSVFTVEIGWNFDMLCAYIWSMILQIFRSKFQAVWEKSVILCSFELKLFVMLMSNSVRSNSRSPTWIEYTNRSVRLVERLAKC